LEENFVKYSTMEKIWCIFELLDFYYNF